MPDTIDTIDTTEPTVDFDAFAETEPTTTIITATPAVERTKSKKPLPNAIIRRQVETTLRLSALAERDRALVARALGVPDDNLREVIVAFLVNAKPAVSALDLLSTVALADPMEAAVVATAASSGERPALRTAWRVLEYLAAGEVSLPIAIPSAPAAAGLAFARAAQSMTEAHKDTVRRLRSELAD